MLPLIFLPERFPSLPYADPEKRKAYRNAYKKRILAERKARQLCIRCATRPVRKAPHSKTCDECFVLTDSLRLDSTQRWRQRMWAEGKCLNCGDVKEDKEKQRCKACNSKHLERWKKRLRRYKEECFAAYGTVCACCKESILDFLGIDHPLNDGYKETQTGQHFYRKLRRAGYPPGYRVLCHNCNLGRHINGGVCPHATA